MSPITPRSILIKQLVSGTSFRYPEVKVNFLRERAKALQLYRGVEQWQLVGLITRRPLVRIQPPLPTQRVTLVLQLVDYIGH